MCGIIGVALKEGNAVKEVFEGLERLEYRGYDSAGLSVLCGGKIETVKRSGRVSGLKSGAEKLSGRAAIGHTRWATHGEPTDRNAHPHTSGNISVVHNGIIENFRELKDELTASGERLLSDTDSEVIVKLIDINYRKCGDLLKAVAVAVKRLKGSYALGVICTDFDGIVAVKYKSPAVIGFAEDGVILCSDIPAMPSCVNSVCVPSDGD
ncbi:MAG: glutamine--fructose-6-phosphate aminotransferase, partial [Clostridia bacterium]|nr:glutamine--fructose-6-phosphate aminotransferase [Clostridia bacterium]